jgi:Protein of unknown function (DUF3175)
MMTVNRWVAKVDTESTYPEEGLFKQDAETIAKELASKKVSPKGPASGMRMLTYFINRGGKNLAKERRAELEKAKGILHELILKQKEQSDKPAARTHSKRTAAKKKTAAKPRVGKTAGGKSVKTARSSKS